MLIDWFTVVAQIVNFLILAVLLKRFLYDKIIHAMDERERKIQDRLNEAEDRSRKAKEEAETYRGKQRELEEKRREMLAEAREEADKESRLMVEDAREKTEQLRSRWRQSLEKEKETFLKKLQTFAAEQVYGISRKALRDLADSDLEGEVADAFLSRIGNLSSEEKRRMSESIRERENRAVIKSGFALSQGNRQKITRAVHSEISKDTDVEYEVDEDLIMGIEIKGGGEKLSFSIRRYLDEMEVGARNMLDGKLKGGS